MVPFLVVVGFLVAFAGFSMLTQATVGVGTICGACFLVIVARIAQADIQHRKLLKAHRDQAPAQPIGVA